MSSDSLPLDQSPPLVIAQPNYSPHTGSHGSVAPVVAVLVAVAVLGVAAAVLGRLCTGKRIMGYGHKYDMESWAESKCSSCIDGRIRVSPPVARASGGGASVSAPSQVRAQDHRETEQTDQHSLHNVPPNNASSCASF